MPPSIAHHVPGCPAFVPGIRLCGHGRFLFSAARRSRSTMVIFAEITTRANNYNSCFGGPKPEKARAFADPNEWRSCFCGPALVLSRTSLRALTDQRRCDR
jgi:hypothetical protein